jgi:O-antigen/teichoic acid export membrane protein
MRFRQLIMQNIIWRSVYFLSVFLLNILVSRRFKADGSGWIYYVINNLSFILLLTGLCLETGMVYFATSGKILQKKLFLVCIPWAFVAAGLSIIILHLFSSEEGMAKNFQFNFASFCYVAGILLINYISALFFSVKNFFLPNFILAAVNFCMFFLLLFLKKYLFIQTYFVELYFSSFLVAGIVMASLYIVFYPQKGWDLPGIGELKLLLKYSLMALAANVAFFLVYRVDYWFVQKFCSGHDLGNYIQVSKFGQVFLILPTMVGATILPFFTGKDRKANTASIEIICRIFLLFSLIASLIIVLVGKWAFPLIYGESFDKMYRTYVLLIPGIIALTILAPLSAYFASQGRIKINILTAVVGVVVLVTGDIIFIPRGGIMAAAIVSSAGYMASLVSALYLFAKQESTPVKNILTFKKTDLHLIRDYLRERLNYQRPTDEQ